VHVTDMDSADTEGYYQVNVAADGTVTATNPAAAGPDTPTGELTVVTAYQNTAPTSAGYTLHQVLDEDGAATSQFAMKDNATGKVYAATVAADGTASIDTVTYTDSEGIPGAVGRVELGGPNGTTKFVTVGTGSDTKAYAASDLNGADLSDDA